MTVTRIEDDSDQLKVPADEIPPVRAVEAAASVDAASAGAAAKVLGTTSTPLTAPPVNAPRQIPGLALRAGVGAPASAKMAPSTKEKP
jgi:hypothetical protein